MPPTTSSDSEDDPDYAPPADDKDEDSSGEQDSVGPMTEAAPPETDPVEQKRRRDALWASFQASVSTPPSDGSASQAPAKRVRITKTYLFAGKQVRDIVEVPEDSEEAKRWPRWSPPRSVPDTIAGSDTREEKSEEESPTPPASTLAIEPSPAATPGTKRQGARKPRTSLPSIPKVTQAKKITTLDKSAMDWHAHVTSQSSDIKDELSANRRGGGYLEKVDFLKRVQDRREDVLEASKMHKRRKT